MRKTQCLYLCSTGTFFLFRERSIKLELRTTDYIYNIVRRIISSKCMYML